MAQQWQPLPAGQHMLASQGALPLLGRRRYNSVMKIIYLAATFSIIYYMRYDKVVKQTYDREQDTFRYTFLLVPCFLLAVVLNHAFTFTEVCWGVGGGWVADRAGSGPGGPSGKHRVLPSSLRVRALPLQVWAEPVTKEGRKAPQARHWRHQGLCQHGASASMHQAPRPCSTCSPPCCCLWV